MKLSINFLEGILFSNVFFTIALSKPLVLATYLNFSIFDEQSKGVEEVSYAWRSIQLNGGFPKHTPMHLCILENNVEYLDLINLFKVIWPALTLTPIDSLLGNKSSSWIHLYCLAQVASFVHAIHTEAKVVFVETSIITTPHFHLSSFIQQIYQTKKEKIFCLIRQQESDNIECSTNVLIMDSSFGFIFENNIINSFEDTLVRIDYRIETIFEVFQKYFTTGIGYMKNGYPK